MKKNVFLLMGLFALLSVCFTSCSKDDDDDNGNSSDNIVGYWASTENPISINNALKTKSTRKIIEVSIYSATRYLEEYMIFTSSNVVSNILVQFDKDKKIIDVNSEDATYAVNGNKVTITTKSNESSTATFSVKKGVLTINFEEDGETVTSKFKSVKEKDVQKYLEWTPEDNKSGLVGGAWHQEDVRQMGGYTLHNYNVYNDDGTMREYLVWFEDNKFTSSEYKDYEWKIEDNLYCFKEKGEPIFTSLINFELKDDKFYFFSAIDNTPVLFATRVDLSTIQNYIDNATPAL